LHSPRSGDVAQVSKPAVAQVSKPAVAQVSKPAERSLGIAAEESKRRAWSLSNGPSDSGETAFPTTSLALPLEPVNRQGCTIPSPLCLQRGHGKNTRTASCKSNAPQVWKPAIQQAWKPALRRRGRFCVSSSRTHNGRQTASFALLAATNVAALCREPLREFLHPIKPLRRPRGRICHDCGRSGGHSVWPCRGPFASA